MASLPRELLSIARERHGLLAVEDLTIAGLTGRARYALFDSGLLVPIHRGVYRIASSPVTFEQRCRAALLAAPDAALSGPTAGRWWGLRKMQTNEVHLLAARAIHLDGVTAHRSKIFGEFDVVQRAGARVLRPVRLFCDLAWHLGEDELESVFEQLLDRRMVSVEAVRAAAKRFVASGRPGSVRLGRVLDSRPAWMKPADSDLELRLWRLLRERGHELDRQVAVELDGGQRVHLDLAVPALRFGIEVDHVTWHGGRLDAQRDKRRDRALARIGWTVVRVTDQDVDDQPAETADDLVAIIDRCAAGI